MEMLMQTSAICLNTQDVPENDFSGSFDAEISRAIFGMGSVSVWVTKSYVGELSIINTERREETMMTLIVILGVLWLLGVITSYTAGGLIHLLLVVAVVMFVINLISGRRAV